MNLKFRRSIPASARCNLCNCQTACHEPACRQDPITGREVLNSRTTQKNYLSFEIGHLTFAHVYRIITRGNKHTLSNQQMEDVKCQMSNWFVIFCHSITASTSPPLTVAPTFTLTALTVPAFGDFISFCIFIASTTTTLSTDFHQNTHNLPRHRSDDA